MADGEDMSYGAINPNEVATLSLLGNGVFDSRTREPFDGTVVNNNAERNADDLKVQGGFTREMIREQGVNQRLSDILFQNNDFRRETQQQINDARAEAAKCCCETQQLVIRENNDTRTLILEQQIQDRDARIAAMQSENSQNAILQQMQLQTQILTQLCAGNGRGNGNG